MNNLAKKVGRIAVMMGGDSAEREVSLKSGKAALEALQSQGFEAFAMDVSFNHVSDNKGKILKTIDSFRDKIRNMGADNKKKSMKYIQNLTKLCNMYFQNNSV